MLKNLRINTKLIAVFLLIGILPAGIIGLISVNNSSNALEEKAFDQLVSLRDVKKGQVENYFGERLGDVSVLSTNPTVIEAMEAYAEAYESGVESSVYQEVDATYSPWLTQYE
ncbi:methyl-accepting chemotaxis protein, partial [candidate division GN15 bacterium]|nr:methyl-accepting chemotaxis protein [candidate division GN15 bacterium]